MAHSDNPEHAIESRQTNKNEDLAQNIELEELVRHQNQEIDKEEAIEYYPNRENDKHTENDGLKDSLQYDQIQLEQYTESAKRIVERVICESLNIYRLQQPAKNIEKCDHNRKTNPFVNSYSISNSVHSFE